MKRWIGAVALAGIAAGFGRWLAVPTRAVRADSAPVTWRGQIAPIVFANCTACHHAGGSGPFDLTTYAGAHRWGPQMASVVETRYMPPWLPEPGPVHFEDDRRMKSSEIELIKEWVKAGMPEGTGAPPVAPRYQAGWQMGPPDLILEMPKAVAVAGSGTDRFENFILPATVTSTHWVRAMEIQPGAGQLVHHANLILDRTGSLRAQHAKDWEDGIPGMDLQIDSGDSFDPDSHFLFWKPDSTALVEPEGMPWRLDPGNDLVLNMHLKPTGKTEEVRARVGLYFTPKPAIEHPILVQLEDDAALDIPAGDANFVVADQLKLPVAVDVLGIYPHAHYLCREMEAWAELPGGRRETLLRINSWDIDRQAVYQLVKPLPLPAGTVLHMRYVYDNSAANVHNPSSPPVRVRAGDRARDEMSHLWVQLLPRGGGAVDGRLRIEQAWMENALRKAPTDPFALYNLGAMAQMEGKPEQAEEFYKRLLAERPGDARAMTSLGAAMEASGDAAGAKVEYMAALTAHPDATDAAFDLATMELSAGEGAEAEARFRRLTEANPEDAAAANGLGQAMLLQGRVKEAQAVFAGVVAHDAQSVAGLNGLAKSDLALREPVMAEPLLLRALAVTDEAETRHLLALTYSAMGDGEKTIEQLRAWARLSPTELDAHRALAQVMAGMGRWTEAIAEQRMVVRLSPGDANDWSDLGAILAEAGQRTEAQAALKHALMLDPGNKAAAGNLDRLQRAVAGAETAGTR